MEQLCEQWSFNILPSLHSRPSGVLGERCVGHIFMIMCFVKDSYTFKVDSFIMQSD